MARSKHGEGSTFQRKDGRWVAQVRLENGKKKQTYHKTEKEAKVALRKMLHELEQGTLATGPQQTLKVYLEQWVEQAYRLRTIRVSTYYNYRGIIRKHVIPLLGYVQLQKLTAQQVRTFYAKKLEEGLSPGRVGIFHAMLHKALADAVKDNLIARNVCDLVKRPKYQRHEMQPLTPEQAKQLLQATREHKLEALLTVVVVTGMRRGELLGLHWRDIDFQAGCLYVRYTAGPVGKLGVVESEPKTQRGKRKIMLPAFVVKALEEHKQRQQEIREQAGDLWEEHDLVFCNQYGNYLSTSTLQVTFKRLLKSAGLPNVRFHDLRHSAATILLGMNVNPKIVQELLGHSTISMTLDIYSHVLPTMQQEVTNRLNDLFGGEGE
jgi:integrase